MGCSPGGGALQVTSDEVIENLPVLKPAFSVPGTRHSYCSIYGPFELQDVVSPLC